ncbi:MAG: TolC family protein [bacterium]
MLKKIPVCVLALTLFGAQAEAAALNMEQCIEIAIRNNFGLKKAEYDYLFSKEATKQVRARYDSVISASGGRTDIESSGANPLYGEKSITDNFSLGLNKKLRNTGGMLSLTWKNTRTDSDSIFVSQFGSPNPSFDSDMTLSYSQPLLKNFKGNNDKTAIEISQMAENIAATSLKLQINILVNKIEKAFLSLNFERENLRAQKTSLERSKKLLKLNKKKLEDGLVEEVDIIATEAAITMHEAALLAAGDSVLSAEDNIGKIAGLKADARLKYRFISEAHSKFKHKDAAPEEVVKTALSLNPALKIIENQIAISSLECKIQENEKFPSLDFVTSYGLGNTGPSWSGNNDALTSMDNPAWYVGFNLNYFPKNSLAKSMLKQREYTREKSSADLEDKKSEIITECRIIARRINTGALYVEAARKSLNLQKKKLQLEEIKFSQGRSSIQWLLKYQDDLSEAEVGYTRALTDYYMGWADLRLITGGER